MQEPHEDYIGLYGNVRIPKSYCESCGGYAFVLDGQLACCGAPHIPEPVRWKRESPPPDERKRPCQADQKLILEAQNYSCFWCDRRFGLAVWLGKHRRVLRIHWDHMIPWAYDQNNSISNFVAACGVCNLWKSSLIFQTIEQCRIYLKGKWDEAQSKEGETVGPEDLPKVPDRVRSEEEVGEVLLYEMPVASVEPAEPSRQSVRRKDLTTLDDALESAVCINPECRRRFGKKHGAQLYCSTYCVGRVERARRAAKQGRDGIPIRRRRAHR